MGSILGMDPLVARRTWQLLEPYHAVVYFDPDAKAIYESVGLKGYWMGYFASRCAAMGEATADVVTATFYNFHPQMVRRAIPDAWRFSSPEAVLEARHRVADTALNRALNGMLQSDHLRQAAAIARQIAEACEPQGRPLFAAHAALGWPTEPHLVLWHAATLWREFRGDGHVAALLVHDIDGCECHVLAAAAGAVPERQREYRGWSVDEWAAAQERLGDRGLLDPHDALTPEGRRLRDRIEALTDELCVAPLASVGEQAVESLHSFLDPLRVQIAGAKAVPYPNAMGLTDGVRRLP